MNQEYQYLVAKLEEALATDDRAGALDIRIVVANGRVHLTGEVATEERRAAVQSIVEEVLPDLDVRNDLSVLELNVAGKAEALDG